MKVLVTGAGGFLGRHVVPALCERGHAIRALGRRPISLSALGWSHLPVETVSLDLCDGAGLNDAVKDIDAVLHLAAEMRGDDARRVAAAEAVSNNLVSAMSRSGVRRVIMASSLSVYDWLRVGKNLDERSPLEIAPERRDAYARAKLAQESIFRRAAKLQGWSLTVLRPGIIWGNGVWDFPQLGQRLGPVYLIIGPTRILPLTHVQNCAEVFVSALDNSFLSKEQTFNVIDEVECSAWRYARALNHRGRIRAFLVPVPFSLGMLLCRALQAVGIHFVPNILMPACYAARFGRPRFTTAHIRECLKLSPVTNFESVLCAMEAKGDVLEQTMPLATSQS